MKQSLYEEPKKENSFSDEKENLYPLPVYAALIQAILIDLSKEGKAAQIGVTQEFFWLDIDTSLSLEELKPLLPYVEEQFKKRAKEGVHIDILDMTYSNSIELAKYLKQTYLKEEIERSESLPFLEICRIGSWAALRKNFEEFSSFCIKEPFQLALQMVDLGNIGESKRHLIRFFGRLFLDQKAKREWLKNPLLEKYQDHFLVGQQKGYWNIFSEDILWHEAGIFQREMLEKVICNFLFQEKVKKIESVHPLEWDEEMLLLRQIKSFYTFDYEPSPYQGYDLLPSILNRGFCKTILARIAANANEVVHLGISLLQLMDAIYKIVRVKNFKLEIRASGKLLPIVEAVPELKNSLIPSLSNDSFLCVSCALEDEWGRRWEVAQLDAKDVKSHRKGFEFFCNLSFRIDWMVAIQLK